MSILPLHLPALSPGAFSVSYEEASLIVSFSFMAVASHHGLISVSFEAGGLPMRVLSWGVADESTIVCVKSVLGYFVVGVLYLDSFYVVVVRDEA